MRTRGDEKRIIALVIAVLFMVTIVGTSVISYYFFVHEPKPAEFRIIDLTIVPDNILPGGEVSISIIVKNVGDLHGEDNAILMVNGAVEVTKNVALDNGENKSVLFTTTKYAPGTYYVEVKVRSDRRVGTFKVLRLAEFNISDLEIGPSKVEVNEPVNISVKVTNIGGVEGSYSVVLKINGRAENVRAITLTGGATEDVTFVVIKEVTGVYYVEVDEQMGNFEVTKPSPLVNRVIVVVLVSVSILIIFVIGFVAFYRRSRR
ncbi:MAG: hypothetical protein CEE41_02330 [Hadesarchaea archaeon B3_Hades]|nr:MAG: hypothetical protein CEE41_02330 [Hadesarchaea archaeon B3_Hades]